MELGVETFLDGDGFEVGLPHLLEQLLVGIHQVFAEQAGKQVGFLFFEADFDGFFPVVVVAVLAFQVVEQPALVGKAVFQVRQRQGKDIIDRFDGCKESAVRRFLETEELDDTQAFVRHLLPDLRDFEDPPSSVCIAMPKPLPCCPNIFSFGIRQSVKINS